MDSLKKLITCGYCKSFFKSPVLLKCCSEKVCKQHILDFKIKNTKMMKCAFCGKEKHHDENYFTIDKSLSEFIGLDSIKSLIENYKKASEKFEKLNTNLKAYNNLKENPEQFVENYFNQIIEKVEQAKKHLINKVEKMAKSMITEIGNHQKGYYKYVVSLGHTSQDDNDSINEILIQNWNSLDTNQYETKAQEFENMNNMVLNKIEKLQKGYLLDKSFNFVENFNIDENFLGKYTIDEFNLASVYPPKMDNVNEANKRKKYKDTDKELSRLKSDLELSNLIPINKVRNIAIKRKVSSKGNTNDNIVKKTKRNTCDQRTNQKDLSGTEKPEKKSFHYKPNT